MNKRTGSDSITLRFYNTSLRFTQQRAISYSRNQQWFDLTWLQYREHVEATARFLESQGVVKGSKVVIFSQTRFEWACLDYALGLLGAISIPIYHNAALEEITFILQDAKPMIVFAENTKLLEVIRPLNKDTEPFKIITMDATEDTEFNFQKLLLLNSEEVSQDYWQMHLDKIETEDEVTHVYTSGTTGTPKAVKISHVQILSETTEAFPLLGVSERDRLLTFLPLAHILGRIEIWGQAVLGYQIAFAEGIDRVKSNLLTVQPTIMVGVPRLFEKIQASVISQIEKSKFKKMAFEWALKLGREVLEHRMNKKPVPIALGLQYQTAYQTIFRKIHDELGGKLRFAVVGGAPLNPSTAYFFGSIGLQLLEGYGLTETTAAICVNTPFDYKYGTVGKPIGDVKIKFAEDGEILVKSDKVMKSYGAQENHSQSFEGEYFKTGDIGQVDSEGFIKIVDRKKISLRPPEVNTLLHRKS